MNTHAKKIRPMKKLLVGILLVICLLYTGFTVIQMAVIILGLLFAGDGFGQLLAFFFDSVGIWLGWSIGADLAGLTSLFVSLLMEKIQESLINCIFSLSI
jgi:hypothetical protein